MNYARLSAAQLDIIVGCLHEAIDEYSEARIAFNDAISKADSVEQWRESRMMVRRSNNVNVGSSSSVVSAPAQSDFRQAAIDIRSVARSELSRLERYLARPAPIATRAASYATR
jgi:hypothetical protein